jgi:hypothetical protein
VAALAVAITAVLLAGDGTQLAATQHRRPTEASCAGRLLLDWADGRIDRTYPVACYRAALRSLPPDLRIYSSAPEDIAHALSRRIVQGAREGTAAGLRRAAG